MASVLRGEACAIMEEECLASSSQRCTSVCTCTGGLVFGSWDSFELTVMLGLPTCGHCLSVREAEQPRPCNVPSWEDVPVRRCALPPGLPRPPRCSATVELCSQQPVPSQQQPVIAYGCALTDEEVEEEGDEWLIKLFSADSGMDLSWAKDLFLGQAAQQREGEGEEEEEEEGGRECGSPSRECGDACVSPLSPEPLSPDESDCGAVSDAGSSDSDSCSSCVSWLEPQLHGMLCAVVVNSLWGDDGDEEEGDREL